MNECDRMGAKHGPRLLVDGTAGRLARWLRIFGLDVEYVGACEPSSITRLARQSGRKAVTRNRNLAGRLRGAAILLQSERLDEQLKQVIGELGRERCEVFSRCNICNAKLAGVAKERVRGRVPEYVYMNHDRFSACPVCGRYYWQGTHWQHMLAEIEAVLEGKRHG